MRKAFTLAVVLALASTAAVLPVSAAEALTSQATSQAGGTVARGCAVVGTAAIAAAVVINTQTLVNVASGVVVAPLSPALLYGGLAAIVASSFCALGYQVVPVFVTFGSAPEPALPATAGERYAEVPR